MNQDIELKIERYRKRRAAYSRWCGFILAVFCSFAGADPVRADWESALKEAFPSAKVVETFDNLQDWNSGGVWANDYQFCGGNGVDVTCPKKIDNSPSIWEYYTNKAPTFEFAEGIGTFASGDQIVGVESGASCTIAKIWNVDGKKYIQPTAATAVNAIGFSPGESIQTAGGIKIGTMVAWPLYIANHGAGKIWGSSGKSLVMNVGDNDAPDNAMAGLGAQRLGTYFGDGTTTSGYRKAHIFFMTKFSADYFGSKPFVVGTNVLKFLDICSGFQSIMDWGTAEEDAATVDYGSMVEYGYQFSIFNWKGGGLSYPNQMFQNYSGNNVRTDDGGATWVLNYQYPGYDNTAADIVAPYLANDWFGVEIAVDGGTVNTANGSTEIWIYDSLGNEIGHQLRSNMLNLVHFDHNYNKTTLGGNRRYGIDLSDRDLRYWVDDFLVSGNRIGPSYFAALSAYENPPSTYSISDFVQLVADWLTSNSSSDKNSDDAVNARDLGIMMSNWE